MWAQLLNHSTYIISQGQGAATATLTVFRGFTARSCLAPKTHLRISSIYTKGFTDGQTYEECFYESGPFAKAGSKNWKKSAPALLFTKTHTIRRYWALTTRRTSFARVHASCVLTTPESPVNGTQRSSALKLLSCASLQMIWLPLSSISHWSPPRPGYHLLQCTHSTRVPHFTRIPSFLE